MSPIILSGSSGSGGFGLIVDPTSEDATNVQLDIADNVSYRPMVIDAPRPALKSVWATSIDVEGSIPVTHQYENQEISVTLRVYGTSAGNLQTQLSYLA